MGRSINARWGIFALGLSLLLLACSVEPASKLPVRRSILDGKVRMLTVPLGEDTYAAYDLVHCQLYKVWRGGVHWQGAAFNNVKTIQPTTWGTAYWEDKNGTPAWFVQQKGEMIPLQADYQAYFLEQGGIRLVYTLRLPTGEQVKISERPDWQTSEGQVRFLRHFTVRGLPVGLSLYCGETEIPSKQGSVAWRFEPLVPPPVTPVQDLQNNPSQYWLDRSGCTSCHEQTERTVGPGWVEIAQAYEASPEVVDQLVQKVVQGGSGKWGPAIMNPHPHLAQKDLERMVKYILSLAPKEDEAAGPAKGTKKTPTIAANTSPGFGAALQTVHPAYDLSTVHPAGFRPRVGGMDFLPDGRLLVCTWDSVGGVYALSGVETGDSSRVRVQQIATGLAEPLGLKVVGTEIFVMQKNELTQLLDHDGDGITDEYRAICDAFGVTADFHEYSYGLEYRDGYFYAPLGLAMRLMAHETQHPDRGTLLKISRDGSYEKILTGLRQTNGIGFGPEQELFLTENQGEWSPACKLIQVQEGDYYGVQLRTGDRYAGKTAALPAVWFPQNEIGNSPSQPVLMQDGPYAGQLLYGEVTHGGIKRVFLEKLHGRYQGCVFRFSQGLEAGINRMAWGPDSALYVGGVGMNGGWSWQEKQFGLQRLKYNGKVPFEMLAVRALPNGLEVEFTQAVSPQSQMALQQLLIQQWRYEATAAYGGPKLDLETLSMEVGEFSEDRKRLRLRIPGLKAGRVVYLRFPPDFQGEQGARLWTGEVWYTLNQLPTYKLDKTNAIIRGDQQQKTLSLVFTGDAYADGGDQIRQMLAKKSVPSAFFLTGNFYRDPQFANLIRQLQQDGHYLGAHSDRHLLYCAWDLDRTRLVSQDSFRQDLLANYAEMARFGISPADAPYFLPPYEWNDARITDWTRTLGLQLINYTPGTLSHADYTTPDEIHYRSSAEIYASILDWEARQGLNGFILLSHIGTAPQRTDKFYLQLGTLIDELQIRGYTFVSLPDLLPLS